MLQGRRRGRAAARTHARVSSPENADSDAPVAGEDAVLVPVAVEVAAEDAVLVPVAVLVDADDAEVVAVAVTVRVDCSRTGEQV